MFELLDILRYVVLPRDKYDMWVWSLEICGNFSFKYAHMWMRNSFSYLFSFFF